MISLTGVWMKIGPKGEVPLAAMPQAMKVPKKRFFQAPPFR